MRERPRPGARLRIPGASQLPEGEARRVHAPDPRGGPDVDLVVCRVGGALFAVDAECPHEGGRIGEGPLEGGRYLVCPLHLYRFDPRDGRAVGVECPPARTYRTIEADGVLEILLDERG